VVEYLSACLSNSEHKKDIIRYGIRSEEKNRKAAQGRNSPLMHRSYGKQALYQLRAVFFRKTHGPKSEYSDFSPMEVFPFHKDLSLNSSSFPNY